MINIIVLALLIFFLARPLFNEGSVRPNTTTATTESLFHEVEKKALAGDPAALRQVCRFVKDPEPFGLENIQISDELKATCAELRPDPAVNEPTSKTE